LEDSIDKQARYRPWLSATNALFLVAAKKFNHMILLIFYLST
jgi:hypothetical protein